MKSFLIIFFQLVLNSAKFDGETDLIWLWNYFELNCTIVQYLYNCTICTCFVHKRKHFWLKIFFEKKKIAALKAPFLYFLFSSIFIQNF